MTLCLTEEEDEDYYEDEEEEHLSAAQLMGHGAAAGKLHLTVGILMKIQ